MSASGVPSTAPDQLRADIHKLIHRLGLESELTVYQCLGVLEIVKIDLVEQMERSHKESGTD